MSGTWRERVEKYVDHVEQIATSIHEILETTKVETSQVETESVEGSMNRLRQELAKLEDKIVERETLLNAADAPAKGCSLTEILNSGRHVDDARLAKRCVDVARQITEANQRAISLFVCQFHLADLSGELIRVLTRTLPPPTYETKGTPDATGGGLFNEAA